MGIFNWRKKEQNIKKEPKASYDVKSRDGINNVFLSGINKVGEISHRNKEITKLIMGRITKHREDDAIYFDAMDHIGFELPSGQDLNDEIMQAVIRQYDIEARQGNQDKAYYIGRLQQSEQGYYFDNKSRVVEGMVNDIAERVTKERSDQIQKQQEENRKMQEDKERQFRDSVSSSANSYMERMQKVREERKANPTLKNPFKTRGKAKDYDNYDGVDLTTGDILRIRKVDKVGKDGSGTYLYSAYLNRTPNEDDVEMFDVEDPMGYPVCFELPRRLADIVKEGNISEITQVLTMLSDERNFQDMEQLTYIGEIDKDGQVNRREESLSSAIQLRIEAMQREYVRTREAKRSGQEK